MKWVLLYCVLTAPQVEEGQFRKAYCEVEAKPAQTEAQCIEARDEYAAEHEELNHIAFCVDARKYEKA